MTARLGAASRVVLEALCAAHRAGRKTVPSSELRALISDTSKRGATTLYNLSVLGYVRRTNVDGEVGVYLSEAGWAEFDGEGAAAAPAAPRRPRKEREPTRDIGRHLQASEAAGVPSTLVGYAGRAIAIPRVPRSVFELGAAE